MHCCGAAAEKHHRSILCCRMEPLARSGGFIRQHRLPVESSGGVEAAPGPRQGINRAQFYAALPLLSISSNRFFVFA